MDAVCAKNNRDRHRRDPWGQDPQKRWERQRSLARKQGVAGDGINPLRTGLGSWRPPAVGITMDGKSKDHEFRTWTGLWRRRLGVESRTDQDGIEGKDHERRNLWGHGGIMDAISKYKGRHGKKGWIHQEGGGILQVMLCVVYILGSH